MAYAFQLIIKAKSEMSTEYLLSTSKLIASKGWSATCTSSTGAVAVSNLRPLRLREVDFGCGDAVLGAPMDVLVFGVCFSLYTNTKGEEGVFVMLRLPAPPLERFANEMETMIKVIRDEASEA